MKYLIKFSKNGMMKYISHLDMIRLFNRAFKRAGIELEHSQGFNPHPKLVFAQPLSLGYTSDCELAQIDTVEAFKEDMLAHMINDQMPNGISILSCKKQERETKSIAAGITEAAYTIKLPEKYHISNEVIGDFISQDEIIAYKKQKRKKELKAVNIKPMIREIGISNDLVDNNIIMNIKVDCGSSSNLNPDVLLKALEAFADVDIKPEDIEIKRILLQ